MSRRIQPPGRPRRSAAVASIGWRVHFDGAPRPITVFRPAATFVGRRTGFNHGVMRWPKENYTLRAAFYIGEGWNRRGVRIEEAKKRAKPHESDE